MLYREVRQRCERNISQAKCTRSCPVNVQWIGMEAIRRGPDRAGGMPALPRAVPPTQVICGGLQESCSSMVCGFEARIFSGNSLQELSPQSSPRTAPSPQPLPPRVRRIQERRKWSADIVARSKSGQMSLKTGGQECPRSFLNLPSGDRGSSNLQLAAKAKRTLP